MPSSRWAQKVISHAVLALIVLLPMKVRAQALDRTFSTFLTELRKKGAKENQNQHSALKKLQMANGPINEPHLLETALDLSKLYLDKNPKLSLQYLSLARPFYGFHNSKKATLYGSYLKMVLHEDKSLSKKEHYLLKILIKKRKYKNLRKRAYETLLLFYYKNKNPRLFTRHFIKYRGRFNFSQQNMRIQLLAISIFQKNRHSRIYTRELERMAKYHPSTLAAKEAFQTLKAWNQKSLNKKRPYYFSIDILRRVNRYSFLEDGLRQEVLSLLEGPVRSKRRRFNRLSLIQKVEALSKIREESLAMDLADRLKEAHSKLDKKRPYKKDEARLMKMLAKFYLKKDDYNLANEYKEKFTLISQKPSNKLDRHFALYYYKKRHFTKAKTAFKKLAKRSRRSQDKWYYFLSTYLDGDYENALKIIEKRRYLRHREFRKYPMARHFWLGKLYRKTAQMSKASKKESYIIRRWPKSYYAHLLKNAHPKTKRNFPSQVKMQLKGRLSRLIASIEPNWVQFLDMSYKKELPSPIMHPKPHLIYNEYAQITQNTAKKLGLEELLITSIIKAESHFRKEAISPVGARGLMQMMPATALKVAEEVLDETFELSDLLKPSLSVAYGGYYLKRLLDYYKGNTFAAVAAYNAGPSAVNKWLEICNDCQPDEFAEIISFPETRNYVKKVFKFYSAYRESCPPDMHPNILPKNMPNMHDKKEAYIY